MMSGAHENQTFAYIDELNFQFPAEREQIFFSLRYGLMIHCRFVSTGRWRVFPFVSQCDDGAQKKSASKFPRESN